MSRQKRTSKVLERAERRASGLVTIGTNLDLGNALTLSSFRDLIEQMRAKQEAYNSTLSLIDSTYVEMMDLEKTLGDWTEKMLYGVACKYGKDSREYEMAGGVRKSVQLKRRSTSRIKSGTVT
ncbi:hypothetical protein [Leptolyngbya sp. FACHB-261]|uniref:hypothetical protein n=1 Tax=Leptolyngbya sp. FACHB-261 TaxID=2692806 RepID=UPI001683F41F|nr:hypothetical protein [Leptolyngbya sp. FACHB-261]MBD2101755.1 hypothetical protein [Leptolyngbya sp. FACHB-261]